MDYIRRTMPFGNAQSLTNDELYAITAYVLYLNDVIKDENFELNEKNFTSIKLPNQPNFIDDDREVAEKEFWRKTPCMANCAAGRSQDHRPRPRARRDAGGRQGPEGRVAACGCARRSALLPSRSPRRSRRQPDSRAAKGTRRSESTCRPNASPVIRSRGRYEGIPPIVGWPDTIFIEIMGEYRAKKRANPIMQTIAVRLSEEEIAALAAYFGSLRPAN